MEYIDIIQKSIDFIEENIKAEITPDELAEIAGFSVYHYYRIFSNITKLSVIQYIVRRRLMHAIYEIQCGRKQINVALDYGFNTTAGFFKAFKKEFDCSPSEYKKKFPKNYPVRINLKQEANFMLTHSKLREILLNWELEQPTKITDMYYDSDGKKMDNSWSINNEYCLKTSNNLTGIKQNIDISKAISNVGFRAVKPILSKDSKEYCSEGDRHYYLTTTVCGDSLKTPQCYEGDYKLNASHLGESIGKLHSALYKVDGEILCNNVDVYDVVMRWAMEGTKKSIDLPESFYEEYVDNFGELQKSLIRHIIHRNPHPGNIILEDSKVVGFINFDISERNVRLFDPCYLSTAILAETIDSADSTKIDKWVDIFKCILSGYDSVCNLTDEEKKSVIYVLYSIQMIFIAYCNGIDKIHDLRDTNCKMLKWLIENKDRLSIF